MAHEHHTDTAHSSYARYIVGFILSVILTAIPFALVMNPIFSKETTIFCVLALAVVQIVVQLYYFLHMDFSPEQRNTLVSFVFTVIILATIIGGSMWIMGHLNHNTMIMIEK